MLRKAYFDHMGVVVGVNSVYIPQKKFNVKELNEKNLVIDLINIKAVPYSKDVKFWAEVVGFDPYDDTGESETMLLVQAVVDGNGEIDGVALVKRGESKLVQTYIP